MKCKKCGGEMKRDKKLVFGSIFMGLMVSMLFGMGSQLMILMYLVISVVVGLGFRKRVCSDCGNVETK